MNTLLNTPLGSDYSVLGKRLGQAENSRPVARPPLNTGVLLIGGTTDKILISTGDAIVLNQPN